MFSPTSDQRTSLLRYYHNLLPVQPAHNPPMPPTKTAQPPKNKATKWPPPQTRLYPFFTSLTSFAIAFSKTRPIVFANLANMTATVIRLTTAANMFTPTTTKTNVEKSFTIFPYPNTLTHTRMAIIIISRDAIAAIINVSVRMLSCTSFIWSCNVTSPTMRS
jgi:hypothetical protein